MSDLVERLRSPRGAREEVRLEAADRLDFLERLRAELMATVDRQEARIEELERALRRLDQLMDFCTPWSSCRCFEEPDALNNAMEQARAVLEKGEP